MRTLQDTLVVQVAAADVVVQLLRAAGDGQGVLLAQTVAEGVETEAQVKRIISLGGDYIQGYYYSRPLPRGQFEEYLKTEKLRKIDGA